MNKMLFVIPLASLVLAGCNSIPFLSKTAEQVQQSADEKALKQEVLKNCTFDSDACKYMASSMKTFSRPVTMRSETNVKGAGLQVSETIMDGTGNMQIVGYEGSKENSNMIILGKATYTKDYKDNAWFEQIATADDSGSLMGSMKEIVDEQKQKLTEETKDDTVMNKLGQEACGPAAAGLTCFKYEMYLPAQAGQQKNPTDKTLIWFDTKEYLVRKMEILYSGMSSTTLYSYEVKPIVKPSPVKQMPTGEEMMKQVAPSQADIDALMKQYGTEPVDDGS